LTVSLVGIAVLIGGACIESGSVEKPAGIYPLAGSRGSARLTNRAIASPIRTAMPTSETVKRQRAKQRQPVRRGSATPETPPDGIEMPSPRPRRRGATAVPVPMNAVSRRIASVETSNNRSHIGLGTPSLSPAPAQSGKGWPAPATPAKARARDSGGHFGSGACFMIGKLSPHPTDAIMKEDEPSGDIRERPAGEQLA